ncbi:MAG: Calx-beta domain-containing protein [Acidobacteriota bacterium]
MFVQYAVSDPNHPTITGNYQTVDGTATAADTDYIPKSGSFTIPSGMTTSEIIPLEIVGDLRFENDEAFTVNASNVVGIMGPPPIIDITIVNDDVPVVTVSQARVTEGGAGTTTTMTFTVTMTPPAGVTVQAAYRTADNTATAGQDYQAASGALVFAIGQATQTVAVIVNGDGTVENDESFTLAVTPVGGSTATGTGTIGNDDVAALGVANTSVTEGNAGTTAMTFTVTLTAPAVVAVQATYSTADGTATAPSDYQATTSRLTFAPNETTQTVTVTVNGDTTVEPDETLTLTVTPVGGVPATGTGTILNDDTPRLARLVIISGNGQRGRPGVQLAQPLVVEAQNSLDAPVAGVVVQWEANGNATLGSASSTTNAQGRASTTVTINNVSAVAVQASAAGLAPVTFNLASETGFEGRSKGPVAVPIARVLDQICARNDGVFDDTCRALSKLDDGQLTPTLEHVAPQQSGAQSKVASAAVSNVAAGIGSRLAALRSGAEGFSVQKLSLSISGSPIPIGALATALVTQAPAGGAADEQKDYNGWSGFLSGNIGKGERIGRNGQLGFDLKSSGIMAGVDRQFGDSVFGVSVNLMKLDSTLNDSTGSLETKGYALSLYGSRSGLFTGSAAPGTAAGHHFDGVHIDGSLTLGRNRYDAKHIVVIPGFTNSVARSKNNANVFALTGGAGIDSHKGRTDYDVSLSGTWSRADIDDLTESGDGPLILFVQGHEIESAVATAGFNVRTAIPTSFGNVLPMFRAEMIHEFKSGARLVTARFLRDTQNIAFTIPLDQPDPNYGKLSAGLQAVFPHGVSAFVEVTQDVLRSDLHFRTIQVNVSKSF